MRTFDYAEGYMEKIRMNLPQFLKRVDAGVSDMTRVPFFFLKETLSVY